MSETVTELAWRRDPPGAVGLWLRLNAVGDIQQHFASYSTEASLEVGWDTVSGRFVILPFHHEKLKGWWWYGRIPIPPPSTKDME